MQAPVRVLGDDELDAIVAGGGATDPAPPTGGQPTLGGYRHYRPLGDAADEFVHSATTRDQRIHTGLPEFDEAMRGLGRKELMVVQGFAHSGKTLFTTQLMLHNRQRRMVLFTPDESRLLVLVKLTSLVSGFSAEKLEEMIAAGHPAGEAKVREAAAQFPYLAVFDDLSDPARMHAACDEAAAAHGGEAELVIFDYAELYQGGDGDGGTPQKINSLKAWGKQRDVPLVLLHQTSRSAGKSGQAISIESGAYGGEQQATFVVGVRRKREAYAAQIRELEMKMITSPSKVMETQEALVDARARWERHRHTVTFNLVKNKRPPSRLVDEQDYTLDAETGRLERMDGPPPDVPAPAMATWSTAPAAAWTQEELEWTDPWEDQ